MNRFLALALMIASLASCSAPEPSYLDRDFTEWDQLNETQIDNTIPGHGSGVRNIFMSPEGRGVSRAVVDGQVVWDYPDGTIILKTVTDRSSGTTTILGMVKDRDNDQSLGGWLWVTRDPATGEERVFGEEFCVSCHGDANEVRTDSDMVPVGIANPDREFRDFVFYPYFAPGDAP